MDQLERLLNQFFNPTSANATQRADIERQLTEIKAREDNWQIAKLCLESSSNPLIIWFAISTYDYILRRRWNSLNTEIKQQIRSSLFEYLLNKQEHLPSYVVTPLANTIVNIGKLDWPHNYPNFFNDTLRAIQTPQHNNAGLLLVRQIAEEFSPNNIKLPLTHKQELITNFKGQLPTILGALKFILEGANPNNPSANKPVAPKILVITLESILQFFSWIPVVEVLHVGLMEILFIFIRSKDRQLSLLALSCVNELLAQSFIPPELSEFLLAICREVFQLLQHFIEVGLQTIGESFLQGFTRFVSLFVSQHIRRVEKIGTFPILQFLDLLARYSFLQSSLEGFLACMDIWDNLLDYLVSESEHQVLSPLHTSYGSGISAVGQHLISKVMYSSNKTLLESLNNSNSGVIAEEEESELANYLTSCLNIISKIVQLYPDLMKDSLKSCFAEKTNGFFQAAQNPGTKDSLNSLNDTIQTLRIFAMNPIYICTQFTIPETTQVLQHICQIPLYILSNETLSKNQDFHAVHTHALITLNQYHSWLNETLKEAQVSGLLNLEISVILKTIQKTPSELVGIQACHALERLGSEIALIYSSEVQNFLSSVPSLHQQLPPKVTQSMYVAVMYLLLGAHLTEDSRQQRDQMIHAIFSHFSKPFYTQLSQDSFRTEQIYLQPDAIEYVKNNLILFHTIFCKSHDLNKKAKETVYSSLKDVIPTTMILFRLYISNSAILQEILQFFRYLFNSFHAQIDATLSQQILGVFMEILGGEQLLSVFRQAQSQLLDVIKSFLEVLQILMSFPSKSFQMYIPHVLQFCITLVYPILSKTEEFGDVKVDMFNLLSTVIENHWSHLQSKPDMLMQIFTTFKHSLEQTDLNVYKNNLLLLDTLNKKCKIFSSSAFADWVDPFLYCLFQVLVHGTHDLLRDEIISTIYTLASLNFSGFFANTLPSLIQTLENISLEEKQNLYSHFKQATDLPSFSSNIEQLVSNYNYTTSQIKF